MEGFITVGQKYKKAISQLHLLQGYNGILNLAFLDDHRQLFILHDISVVKLNDRLPHLACLIRKDQLDYIIFFIEMQLVYNGLEVLHVADYEVYELDFADLLVYVD